MKEWQKNAFGGVIIAIMGIGMILWATYLEVPSRYDTFLGIPYSVNPEFVFVFQQFMILIVFGLFALGMSMGILLTTYTIFKLEKERTS